MKKALLIALFTCVIGLYAQAQTFTYGAKIAGGIAYQHIKNPEVLSTNDIKTFNIKGVVQMALKHNFSLEGGLGIANKGGIFYQDALTTTVRLTYVELPVELMRKFNFTNLGLFYVGAGGYLARGLSGSIKYETPGIATTDKLKFGKDNDADRLDAGLDFSTGFEFKNHVTFNVGYKLGLNNIASTPQKDTGTSVVRNTEFTVGLGYIFK